MIMPPRIVSLAGLFSHKKVAVFLYAASAMVVSALLPTAPAWAQQQCAPRQILVDVLREKYEEVPVSRGIASGNLLEVFTNADRSTWSIVIHTPSGQSCVVASGEHWQGNLSVEPAGMDL